MFRKSEDSIVYSCILIFPDGLPGESQLDYWWVMSYHGKIDSVTCLDYCTMCVIYIHKKVFSIHNTLYYCSTSIKRLILVQMVLLSKSIFEQKNLKDKTFRQCSILSSSAKRIIKVSFWRHYTFGNTPSSIPLEKKQDWPYGHGLANVYCHCLSFRSVSPLSFQL